LRPGFVVFASTMDRQGHQDDGNFTSHTAIAADLWLFWTMRDGVRIALFEQDFDTLREHGLKPVTIKARR
jgi:hypothetical protein